MSLLTLLSPQGAPAPSTNIYVKVGGVWKTANIYVKVGGTWKIGTMYAKAGGTWH